MKKFRSTIFKPAGVSAPRPGAEARRIMAALSEYAAINIMAADKVEAAVKDVILGKLQLWRTQYITHSYCIDRDEYARLLSELTGHPVEFNKQGVVRIKINGKYIEGKSAWGEIKEIITGNYKIYGRDSYNGLDFDRIHFSLSPYNILMMSTRKPWTSCTDLNGGDFASTAVVYSQLPYYGILYFSKRGKIKSRVIMFYNGEYVALLKVYGNNVSELVLKSAVRRIINDLQLLDSVTQLTEGADNGSYRADYGYHDPVIFAYKGRSTESVSVRSYQNITVMYIDENYIYCYSCGKLYNPLRPSRVVCIDCDNEYVICCECEREIHIDDACVVWGEYYCGSCYDDVITVCYCCSEYIRIEQAINVWDTNDEIRHYCEDCANREAFTCDHCGYEYINSMRNEVYINSPRGVVLTHVCDNCVGNYCECDECNNLYSYDYVTVHEGRFLCNRCLDNVTAS